MKNLQSLNEVLISWRQCMERGLSSKILPSVTILESESLKKSIADNNLLLSTFDECCNCVMRLITSKYFFVFVDTQGTVLGKKQVKI